MIARQRGVRIMELEERLAAVLAEIARAAAESGRSASDITLVAATKTNDAETVRRAIAAGVRVCGENRVQEMLDKQALGAYVGARLDFIGHLQRNKVRQTVGLAALIHSVDSLPLLEEIDRCARSKGLVQQVLLEINIGSEASKSGLDAAELPAILTAASAFPGIWVRGLMAIPPICASGEENRPYFQRMENLFIDNSEKKYDNVSMDFLSMGMSGDFAAAISCGANIVRVGSAIFGPRVYPA